MALTLACALVSAGCGNNFGKLISDPVFVGDCDGSVKATDLIILDWSGGTSKLYPDDEFAGLDFASFETSDGGTLADGVEAFKDSVRREVLRVLCELPSVNIVVRNEKDRIDGGATNVYIVQAPSQVGGGQIGEGEFDPCNLQSENSALVFGDELLDLPGAYSFDDWVLIFANVAAHEIGHTLGFHHVPRSTSGDSEHSLYVELMLAGHTVEEMIRPQRFLSDDGNCPEHNSRSRFKDAHTFTCRIIE